MDGHCDVAGHSWDLICCCGIAGWVGGGCCIDVGLVSVAFVFVEARALEPGAGVPFIRLFSVAYPLDFILGIFPFPSVTIMMLSISYSGSAAWSSSFCSRGVGCRR